jgi:hypothetical protein
VLPRRWATVSIRPAARNYTPSVESGGRRLPRPGILLALFSIIVLLLVVALASRPDTGVQPAVGPEPGRVVLDSVFYLLICAGLAGLVAAIWALWPNPDLETQPLERRHVSLGLALFASLAVLGLVWARSRWGRLPDLPQRESGGAGFSPGSLVPGGLAVNHGTDWLAILITLVVILAAGVLLWRQLRPRRHNPRLGGPPGAVIGEVLDDAVDDVLAEEDPRRAVIAAWTRLERVLAAHGHARRAPEAPFEYAARAFAELGLAREALDRFAALYEWARFSVNQVTPGMREEALDRLLSVRESIRVGT